MRKSKNRERTKMGLSYEEDRQKRVEENKKRLEELNIKNLSLKLPPMKKLGRKPKPKTKEIKMVAVTPVRRSARGTPIIEEGAAAKKRKPAIKDPNKPKRPSCAFFVFMEDFRVQFNAKHPDNKSVAAVGKAGGEKWKLMSDVEKAPFIQKAEKIKADYEMTMNAYNKRLADKSRSEVIDEDDGDDSGEENEDDD